LADDILNIVPARITALLLRLAWPRCSISLRQLSAEAHKTPSPNSGWPMSALALAHDIRLGKPGVYVLNAAGRAPASADTTACLNHFARTAWISALLFAAVSCGVRFCLYG
jgi:adenosylcobinamide-phosphate synthase